MIALKAMKIFFLFTVTKVSVARKNADELPKGGLPREFSHYGDPTSTRAVDQ